MERSPSLEEIVGDTGGALGCGTLTGSWGVTMPHALCWPVEWVGREVRKTTREVSASRG